MRLAMRPVPGARESILSILARAAIGNGKHLQDLDWWTSETSVQAGADALLVGRCSALAVLGEALDTSGEALSSYTLRPYSRGTELTPPARSGPLDLSGERPHGRRPDLTHRWRLPYCPSCLQHDPRRFDLATHIPLSTVCLQHRSLKLIGCPACQGKGMTVAGQAVAPGRCAQCGHELSRSKARALDHVEGLAEAAMTLTTLQPDGISRDRRLDDIVDLLLLSLVTGPEHLLGQITGPVRRHVDGCRNSAAGVARASRPDPGAVAAHLPAVLATLAWRENHSAPSALVTLNNDTCLVRCGRFLGPGLLERIHLERAAWATELNQTEVALLRPAPRTGLDLPPLLPRDLYDRHFGDLVEQCLAPGGWPGPVHVRAALSHLLSGRSRWSTGKPFGAGTPHRFPNEIVLAATFSAVEAEGREAQWYTAVRNVLNTDEGSADWRPRARAVSDPRFLTRVLERLPAVEPDEGRRWLHQVWGSIPEPDLGLYGSPSFLLDGDGPATELEAELRVLADRQLGDVSAVRAGVA